MLVGPQMMGLYALVACVLCSSAAAEAEQPNVIDHFLSGQIAKHGFPDIKQLLHSNPAYNTPETRHQLVQMRLVMSDPHAAMDARKVIGKELTGMYHDGQLHVKAHYSELETHTMSNTFLDRAVPQFRIAMAKGHIHNSNATPPTEPRSTGHALHRREEKFDALAPFKTLHWFLLPVVVYAVLKYLWVLIRRSAMEMMSIVSKLGTAWQVLITLGAVALLALLFTLTLAIRGRFSRYSPAAINSTAGDIDIAPASSPASQHLVRLPVDTR